MSFVSTAMATAAGLIVTVAIGMTAEKLKRRLQGRDKARDKPRVELRFGWVGDGAILSFDENWDFDPSGKVSLRGYSQHTLCLERRVLEAGFTADHQEVVELLQEAEELMKACEGRLHSDVTLPTEVMATRFNLRVSDLLRQAEAKKAAKEAKRARKAAKKDAKKTVAAGLAELAEPQSAVKAYSFEDESVVVRVSA